MQSLKKFLSTKTASELSTTVGATAQVSQKLLKSLKTGCAHEPQEKSRVIVFLVPWEEICDQEMDIGQGIINPVTRWYYESTDVCMEMDYTGGGNQNNFHTEEDCLAFCNGNIKSQLMSDQNSRLEL